MIPSFCYLKPDQIDYLALYVIHYARYSIPLKRVPRTSLKIAVSAPSSRIAVVAKGSQRTKIRARLHLQLQDSKIRAREKLASKYERVHVSPYVKFVLSPSKSSFKELIVSTPLRHQLATMSEAKSVPKGLKDQEVERGSVKKRPPVPYVPVVDEVQDAVNKTKGKESTYTIKLPDKTQFTVNIWDTGTPEAFLIHVQTAVSACRRKGLFSDFGAATEKARVANEEVTTFREVIKTAKARKVKKGEEQPKPPTDTQESLERALAALAVAREEKQEAAEGFFSQYANLLTEDARYHWDKIVASQCDVAPWTDLQGKEQARARQKSHDSFEDCVTFHLLNVFQTDAAERQRFYISNVLKKPQRVPVRYFFQRVEQLNGYLLHLPCLYNSPRATIATCSVAPFDDAELANLLLRMCPEAWQNQYDLTQETVPQDLRKLLTVLENIEKCEESAGANLKPSATANGNGKPNGNNEKSGKRKGTNSYADRIPKKVRTEKYCALCKKYGGAHTTHDTGSCSKFEKDGTEKPSWSSKLPRAPPPKYAKKEPSKNSYAALKERFSKLEKAVRKRKGLSRKKKRYASSDSDSDSE